MHLILPPIWPIAVSVETRSHFHSAAGTGFQQPSMEGQLAAWIVMSVGTTFEVHERTQRPERSGQLPSGGQLESKTEI
jgi:hypothetical protein